MRYISPAIREISGYPPSDFLDSQVRTFASIIHPEDQRRLEREVQEAVEHDVPYTLEYRIVTANGDVRWIYERGCMVKNADGEPCCLDGVLFDHTLEHQVDDEQADLVLKLREALAKIKRLHGLLPICSNCKMIRDDDGYWKELEIYIQSHSDATFTHSICPACMDELYRDEPWFNRSRYSCDSDGNSD